MPITMDESNTWKDGEWRKHGHLYVLDIGSYHIQVWKNLAGEGYLGSARNDDEWAVNDSGPHADVLRGHLLWEVIEQMERELAQAKALFTEEFATS